MGLRLDQKSQDGKHYWQFFHTGGYLGSSHDEFDAAMDNFTHASADQAERDHTASISWWAATLLKDCFSSPFGWFLLNGGVWRTRNNDQLLPFGTLTARYGSVAVIDR